MIIGCLMTRITGKIQGKMRRNNFFLPPHPLLHHFLCQCHPLLPPINFILKTIFPLIIHHVGLLLLPLFIVLPHPRPLHYLLHFIVLLHNFLQIPSHPFPFLPLPHLFPPQCVLLLPPLILLPCLHHLLPFHLLPQFLLPIPQFLLQFLPLPSPLPLLPYITSTTI
ncbi:unnamed protein product [Meloidogyne enterolobii]|uniref:Uncharacterized protein n=1 Tax=Meloidogyne enterolobii TaxID=390850 RepID=A0ACB0XZC3_MELEN